MKRIAFFISILTFSYSTLCAEVTNEILNAAADKVTNMAIDAATDIAKDVATDVIGDVAKDVVGDVAKDVVGDVAGAAMPAIAIAMMNLTENTKNDVLTQQQYNIGAVVATQESVVLSNNERLFNEQKLNGLLNNGNSIRAIEKE